MTSEQETILSMVLRELCNNLIKHARCQHCCISVYASQSSLHLSIEDDGVGFSDITGQELAAIKNRLLPYGGQVEIVSAYSPTHIQVDLPREESM
ncbi:ATP-binding protein [Streptococcus sp. zg-JUN1979]|uniref:ATP-binding protein n=1 Tax=Streptococcus sp. zg-JUN1979 TaxID=3391450 RepID=UPI0039A43539